ncbi:hypothetical protein ACLOJK_004786 [Asimina triloba]
MSASSSSSSRVPPGFRFHPTEEELLQYYLRKKVASDKIDLDVIREIDLNKLEPWEIQEKCKIGSTPQNDWYFFSHKDKKYPTGTRTNRATSAGFWKATGRDKVIYASSERIGMRKTLVFYKGRAPHGQKSDWIMHEYRLDDQIDSNAQPSASNSMAESAQEDGWVVCRIFKKKNHPKALEIPSSNSSIQVDAYAQGQMGVSGSDGAAFEEILQCMGKTCKKEADSNQVNIYNIDSFGSDPNNTSRYSGPTETEMGDVSLDTFMQMPHLESPTLETHHSTDHNQPFYDTYSLQNCYSTSADANALVPSTYCVEAPVNTSGESISSHTRTGLTNWVVVDRFAASQLNGHSETPTQLASCFSDPSFTFCSMPDQDLSLPWHLRSLSRSFNTSQDLSCNETGLWPFARLT